MMESIFAIAILGGIHVRSEFETEIRKITEEITRNYYADFDCLAYVTRDGNDPPFDVPAMIVNLNAETGNETILVDVYNAECRGFVVRVPDRSKVAEILINSYEKAEFGRYNNKRYLFLPWNETDRDADFLEERIMYFLPNLVFVSPIENGFDLLSHNYFNGHKYNVLGEKYEVIDSWRTGIGLERNVNLYPDQMADLNGREMIFALTHYEPYALIIQNGNETEYDGLETRIAAIFAEKKNATWTGKYDPVRTWGDVYEDGSSDGIIGFVIDQSADIGFSAYYQWHCDVVECSYPYIYAGVTCLVPKPELLSGWYTIALPFELPTWGTILACYLISSVFVFFISLLFHNIKKQGRRHQSGNVSILLESFFTLFRLQLLQTFRDTGARTPMTAFVRIWILYAFFVASSWQGGISSVLTVPRYEKPINTPEDLIDRWPKVEWGGIHIDWMKSILQTEDPPMKTIVERYRILDEDILTQRVRDRNFGHFMERLPNGHYGINDYLNEEAMKYLKIMEGDFYIGNCVMILHKCSPYLEELDKVLFWTFDTGLIQKLEIQTSLEKVNNRLQKMIRLSTEKERTGEIALLVSHIQGAIFIYACGIIVSIATFAIEICLHRFNQNRSFNSRFST